MNDQSQMINQSQMMNQSKMMNSTPMMSQAQMMNQQQFHMMNSTSMMSQAPAQSMMSTTGVGYGRWLPVKDQLSFNQNPMSFPGFGSSRVSGAGSGSGRNNWKGKKGVNNDNNKRKDLRKKGSSNSSTIGMIVGGSGGGGGGGGGGYRPPTLNELQNENRLKARKYFHKKKFDKFNNNRSAPFAPRNTSSYIIRAKKSGGIASLVSPCPVTPAVLPTPMFSPSREALVDTAKEEWGVDGYGSMKGLIRLRSPGNEADVAEEEEDEEGGSSESDVEEHLEVERRLDHDLSRFEMIYPNYGGEYNNVLENRVDDQDTHIAQVEEENLILKERLFLMEREMGDLRRRLLNLERQHQAEEINEEVVENDSENDSESRGGYYRSPEENNGEMVEENNEGGELYVQANEQNNNGDVTVKDVNFIAPKENNKKGDVEVKDSSNVNAKEENSKGDVELKATKILVGNNGDVGVKDGSNVNAKEENSIGDVELKATNFFVSNNRDVEAKDDSNVEAKDDSNVNAKAENNNGGVELNAANFFENNNGDVEIMEANNMGAMGLNNNGDTKLNGANNFKTLNDAVVRDVCMEELAHKQDEVNAEKGEDVGGSNEGSEG